MDKISGLPDDLLRRILSFLSTKEAVATSVLSKRWEHIWTEVTVLDFTRPRLRSMESFKTFVGRTLHRNISPELKLFRFVCAVEIEYLLFSSWINSVLSRDIFEIDLCYHTSQNMRPTLCILRSDRLRILKLDVYNFPVCRLLMPKLTSLHLNNLTFNEDFSLTSLLSSLPSLSELRIRYCSFEPPRQIVCSASLERLVIEDVSHVIMTGMENEPIVIEAQHLQYLSISDDVSYYEFKDMPLLDEARLSLHCKTSGNHNKVLELLKYITCSKTLVFDNPTIQLLQGVNRHHQLPLFLNLTSLDVDLYGSNCDFIFCLLNRTPNLESLKVSDCYFLNTLVLFPLSAPCCLCSTLKAVSVGNFWGSLVEEQVVEYFLTNAKVLKVMTIHIQERNYRKEEVIYAITRLSNMVSETECEFRVLHS